MSCATPSEVSTVHSTDFDAWNILSSNPSEEQLLDAAPGRIRQPTVFSNRRAPLSATRARPHRRVRPVVLRGDRSRLCDPRARLHRRGTGSVLRPRTRRAVAGVRPREVGDGPLCALRGPEGMREMSHCNVFLTHVLGTANALITDDRLSVAARPRSHPGDARPSTPAHVAAFAAREEPARRHQLPPGTANHTQPPCD